jgi:hypothetical protein
MFLPDRTDDQGILAFRPSGLRATDCLVKANHNRFGYLAMPRREAEKPKIFAALGNLSHFP